MTNFKSFLDKAKKVEEEFSKLLLNPRSSNTQQDIHEHWDVAGILPQVERDLKFDVKGLKKLQRQQTEYQDDFAWIELKNVRGNKGWLYGKADYIVFERFQEWLLVHREKLIKFTEQKLKDLNYNKGRKAYHIYNRVNRKDELTLIPFHDMEKLSFIIRIPKEQEND